MSFKKRIRSFTLLLVSFCAGYGWILYEKDANDLPPLKNGDIIFQTTPDQQALPIALATISPYTHTGIIKESEKGYQVVEAAAIVQEIPLERWLSRGLLKRFAVYRYKGLSADQGANVIQATGEYYGKPYDIFFSFENDAIYCSELPYLAFAKAGIAIGKVEKVSELHVNNAFARKLIEQRWKKHPQCAGKLLTFEQCYEKIMSVELISPASIARDTHFARIFTNYP